MTPNVPLTVPIWTIESVVKSHGRRAHTFELSIVLDRDQSTATLSLSLSQNSMEFQIDTVVGRRCRTDAWGIERAHRACYYVS